MFCQIFYYKWIDWGMIFISMDSLLLLMINYVFRKLMFFKFLFYQVIKLYVYLFSIVC